MKRFNILIVDDDRDFVDSMAELVELEGYIPILAYSGEQAIEMMKTVKLDMALIDVRMPKMNGIETLKQLHAINPDIKAAMMSGYPEQWSVAEAKDIGVAGFFDKPINIKKILKLIEELAIDKAVLLVDDDHDFADSLQSLLENNGHTVYVAYNGKDALNYIKKNTIKFVLLDIRMEGMNGIELYKVMRDKGLEIPTLIITAYADEYMDELDKLKLPVTTEIFNKPFNFEELILKLESIGVV